MGQCAQRKCVLIRVVALRQQFTNEVSGANIMHQVAEFDAAEWIVSKVLYHRPTIRVGMSFLDLILRETGVPVENQWQDFIRPQQVNDLFVGQHGVC